MRRVASSGLALSVTAAFIALVFAALVTVGVLIVTGYPPVQTIEQMVTYGSEPDSVVNTINRATTFFLSAIAVAIGFQMKLFNIGVDGQYRLAAFLAAAAGGSAFVAGLPPGLQQLVIIVVAMLVGGVWAGIAGVLKVTRGVSEVISTIMLNFIGGGVISYLLSPGRLAIREGNNLTTRPIGPDGQVPGIPFPDANFAVYGLIVLAIVVGFLYHAGVRRTRFGFDLRATGLSAPAALASGVDVRRMTVAAMLLSGLVAGLVGIPQLLGDAHRFALDFPVGIGFTGIAIALLGRNNALGIALSALLFAFLTESAQILDLNEIPKEIVTITQAVVVLSVVVVYEVVHRFGVRIQRQAVGRQLATAEGGAAA
ncbi:MAG: ABC transporter permease [Streptosporangiales bacterium]|nr:ABC transporter permease [Streptosporangiales bacterium]